MYEKFVDHQHSKGLSDLTIQSYQTSWNRFVNWFQEQGGNPEEIFHVTQRDIADYRRYLQREGGRKGQPAKQSTIKISLLHLKAIFNFFISEGIVPDNPAQHVKQPPKPRRTPKWLSRNEQNAFLRAVRSSQNIKELAIAICFLQVGFRVNELCEAKIADFKMSDRKGNVLIRGKGDKDREVPLNSDVRNILMSYLSWRKDMFKKIGERDESPFLFISERGQKYSTRGVQHIIEKYRDKTGIAHLTCHALRHSFGHDLVTATPPVRLEVVARLMGHFKENGDPNIDMTLIYTTPGTEELEEAVESLTWT